MVKIRLMRTGRRNQPSYRIVVADARVKRDGRHIEILGFYNPLSTPKQVQINSKRYQYWISQGAQPTQTVKKLYQKTNP